MFKSFLSVATIEYCWRAVCWRHIVQNVTHQFTLLTLPFVPWGVCVLAFCWASAPAALNAGPGGGVRSPDDAVARSIVRRLISSRRSEHADGQTPARAAAAACDALYHSLSRWIGLDGCHALFAGALARSRRENPPLQAIQLRARSTPYVEGVGESIDAHGDAAVAEALESMLVRLVELLGRLIGDEMAASLIERGLAGSDAGAAASGDKRGNT